MNNVGILSLFSRYFAKKPNATQESDDTSDNDSGMEFDEEIHDVDEEDFDEHSQMNKTAKFDEEDVAFDPCKYIETRV